MKFKVPYSIKKALIRILPFMATAIMAASCHKEPYKEITVDYIKHIPNRIAQKVIGEDKYKRIKHKAKHQ